MAYHFYRFCNFKASIIDSKDSPAKSIEDSIEDPNDNNQAQIFLRGINGNACTVDISLNETIADLKAKLGATFSPFMD